MRSLLSALLLALVLAACSSAPGSRSPQTVAALGYMWIEFENTTAEMATVSFDALPVQEETLGDTGGDRWLGQVRSERSQSYRIQASPTPYRIVAHYATLDSAYTESMDAQPGDTLQVTAGSDGSLSTQRNR